MPLVKIDAPFSNMAIIFFNQHFSNLMLFCSRKHIIDLILHLTV